MRTQRSDHVRTQQGGDLAQPGKEASEPTKQPTPWPGMFYPQKGVTSHSVGEPPTQAAACSWGSPCRLTCRLVQCRPLLLSDMDMGCLSTLRSDRKLSLGMNLNLQQGRACWDLHISFPTMLLGPEPKHPHGPAVPEGREDAA